MKSSRTLWIRGMHAVVLAGGLLITGWGLGVTAAAPPASNPGNSFQAILDKLDQVLAAITSAAGQGNHTLRWDTNNLPDNRFTVLTDFSGKAVLDKNTGLVWEQAPDTVTMRWDSATLQCANRRVGGTTGWRLPSVVELMSLLDPTAAAPFVPAVFSLTNVAPEAFYWSATEFVRTGLPPQNGSAWYMGVGLGSFSAQYTPEVSLFRIWCVRGGMNADHY